MDNPYLQSLKLLKYPRTPHLQGSKLQPGDEDLSQVPLEEVAGEYAVIEEKVDCAQSGISCSEGADLLLQSKGHYLTGGANERQFNRLKEWGRAHEDTFLRLLEDRFVMYGEWCYEKHAIFYDQLPHYFNEFDIQDRHTGDFWSTQLRRELLRGSPVVQVPVLFEGVLPKDTRVLAKMLQKLIRPSLGQSPRWKEVFEQVVKREKLDLARSWQQTDATGIAEGLYIKRENEKKVLGRYKFVRKSFVQAVVDSEEHVMSRLILPNQLAAGVDPFAPQPVVTWEHLGLQTMYSWEEVMDRL